MPPRILMIDDDPDMVTLGKLILEREDKFEVVSTYSGRTGLKILDQDKNVDLVLIDVTLVDMNAWDVLKAIRNNNDHIHLPVIMVAAYPYAASPKARTIPQNAWIDGYILKPFVVSDLIDRISEVIQRNRVVAAPA